MSPRQNIAHYKVTAKLGEGGMGAVYRATDTRLNREVAIKVLPSAFAEDAARMQRFEREAQVLASLNHPNIAAIYGIEQSAIVMELVEGPDLRGPLPVETAVQYARQIAAGLEAAHEKGIVHRDLKPANIKITPEGVVKILDFGLAKSGEPGSASTANSPTLTISATQAGTILGTAGYMAPEQARGKPVDKRADIWAFGVVLFEMLTGSPLFAGGDTVTDIIAAVVTREPDWSALPKNTPPPVRRLLERCLLKDPKLRLRDIGEARIALDEPSSTNSNPPGTGARPGVRWWAAAAAITVAGAASWTGARISGARPTSLVSLNVNLGPDSVPGTRSTVALSPDGTRIVSSVRREGGETQLAMRLLSDSKSTIIAGTEGGSDAFFSPDGRYVGFFAGSKLKTVAVQGGAVISVCDAENDRGAAWLDDGTIVFAPSTTSGLMRVKGTGGAPQRLTDPAARHQTTHRWPQALPGGRALLYTAHTTNSGFDDAAEIDVLDMRSGQSKTVHRGGYFGRYLPSGHLLFVNRGSLFAVRFDLSRLETVGTPVMLASDLAVNAMSAAGQFSVSAEGTGILVYLPGRPQELEYPIQWLSASGETEMLLPAPRLYNWPRLSPDGRMLAVSAGGMSAGDLFVLDIGRRAFSQLTFNAQSNLWAEWAPDGKHLAVVSKPDSHYVIWWIRADGAGQPRKLHEAPNAILDACFAPDGRRLAYSEVGTGTGGDLWTLPLDLTDPENPAPGKPEVLLQTPFIEMSPAISPDGRWVAYRADDSVRSEIYVRPFPVPGGKWLISTDGGMYPVWSRGSRQLFYLTPNGAHVMVVDYDARGDTFVAGPPRPFAESRHLITGAGRGFDVSADGKRLVGFISEDKGPERSGNVQVVFQLNFFDELKRRLP